MADSTSRVFYIGLNMPGAVSAGAYTAGALDFLIDALDTWYAERARQKEKHGNNFDQWEIPAHEVRLLVMSGASAGGMNAAIAAAELCENFTPVRSIPDPSFTPPNRLYKSWVSDIDLQDLLGKSDLRNENDTVESILDCSCIDGIAADALRVTKPVPARREYLSDGLKVILTLTNLKGIPYAIEDNAGAAETRTLYRADQQKFEIWWSGSPASDSAIVLNPNKPDNWTTLQEAAKATGAFPLMLRPRVLKRTTTEYDLRKWRIPVDSPESIHGKCQCERLDYMPPMWGTSSAQGFQTVNVDGGITNNSPFDCANTELSFAPPEQALDRAPRSPLKADRAVISIAPFLTTPQFDINAKPDVSLLGVLGQLIDTVVNQSRIQGENIKLARDESVYSNFHISPSIDETTRNALASASLGAFGGFVAREFRDHDYQLGRRNCQRFLQAHFGLPLENEVMRQYAPTSDSARTRLLDQFGMTLQNGTQGLAVIPVIGELQNEVRVKPTPIHQDRLLPLANLAAARCKLVLSRLLKQYGSTWGTRMAFEVAWFVAQDKFKNMLLTYAGRELARQGLVD